VLLKLALNLSELANGFLDFYTNFRDELQTRTVRLLSQGSTVAGVFIVFTGGASLALFRSVENNPTLVKN
jgi:hypothetical protein